MAINQRNRRRRNRRQRVRPVRRVRRRNRGAGPPINNLGSYTNPNSWLSGSYEINIDGLTAASDNQLFGIKFQSIPDFFRHLSLSGEYKYLRATVVYSPLGGKETDRIGIAPFFDPSSAFRSKIDFVTSGRKIRRADQPLTEILSLPSQITSSELEIIGGVVLYYSGDIKEFGILSILLHFQVRGRRTLDEVYKAAPYKPPAIPDKPPAPPVVPGP